jgi:hypothetical protein
MMLRILPSGFVKSKAAFFNGKAFLLCQSFRFDKNGLHSVTADGQFKMALLLVLE